MPSNVTAFCFEACNEMVGEVLETVS